MSQATDSRYDTPLDSAISAALKEPAAACSLPGDFTGRFVRHMNGAPTRSRLPRWLKLAACFALLLSGAAFAVTVVVDAVTAKGNGGEEMVGSVVPNSPDAHILNGASIASEMGGTRSVASSEVQAAPSVSSVPSTDNRQTTGGNRRKWCDDRHSTADDRVATFDNRQSAVERRASSDCRSPNVECRLNSKSN